MRPHFENIKRKTAKLPLLREGQKQANCAPSVRKKKLNCDPRWERIKSKLRPPPLGKKVKLRHFSSRKEENKHPL